MQTDEQQEGEADHLKELDTFELCILISDKHYWYDMYKACYGQANLTSTKELL